LGFESSEICAIITNFTKLILESCHYPVSSHSPLPSPTDHTIFTVCMDVYILRVPTYGIIQDPFLRRHLYVPQAGLQLLGSRDPPASESRILGLQVCATTPDSTVCFCNILLGKWPQSSLVSQVSGDTNLFCYTVCIVLLPRNVVCLDKTNFVHALFS
jgi:hypothetical protein